MSFAQYDSISKTDRKPAVVFIKTSWCKICEMMEQSVFKDADLANLINDNFHFVRFDAQSTKPVSLDGREFNFQPSGKNAGIHDLAYELAEINGQVSYPTLVILNADLSVAGQFPSYIDAKKLTMILKKYSLEQTNDHAIIKLD